MAHRSECGFRSKSAYDLMIRHQILREGYSHPSIEGIIMFVSLAIAGFKDMALMLMRIFIILQLMTLWTSSSISGKLSLRKS
ncbi:hypothetical protein Ahy_A06g028854 [Arachis hypogaea]|uniref:Uncharacterized protein n=1 Tax=Arachis hypogaea TaxID=3818 RepID=A0A445CRV9_ARAHY|nr:hypothetical protein Ahy_A06g028854 [Arachis hypogaea]